MKPLVLSDKLDEVYFLKFLDLTKFTCTGFHSYMIYMIRIVHSTLKLHRFS